MQGHSRSKKRAEQCIAEANRLIMIAKEAQSVPDSDTAERLLRQCLQKIREACLWQPNVRAYREFLHRVGLSVHEAFGCQLELRDGQYWVNCPVLLWHNRKAFATGGAAKAMCSVCGKDSLGCSHTSGLKYDGVVAWRLDENCNVCGEQECGHQEGETYDQVAAFAIHTEMDLDHAAMGDDPAHPPGVAQEYPLPQDDLLKILPAEDREALKYGETMIYCHHCVECHGHPGEAPQQAINSWP